MNTILKIVLQVTSLVLFTGGIFVMWKIFGGSIKERSRLKKEEKKAKKAASKNIKKQAKTATPEASAPNIAPDIQLSGGDKTSEGLSLGDWKNK